VRISLGKGLARRRDKRIRRQSPINGPSDHPSGNKENDLNQRPISDHSDHRDRRDHPIREGALDGDLCRHTWSELIEEALRTLRGSHTALEITAFLENHYGLLLSAKTKTWRNSVMGCLSSNARKRWIKEQTIVNGRKRFVWSLTKDMQSSPEILFPDRTETNTEPQANANANANANARTRAKTRKVKSLTEIQSQTKPFGLPEIGSPFAAKTLSNLGSRLKHYTDADVTRRKRGELSSKLFQYNSPISFYDANQNSEFKDSNGGIQESSQNTLKKNQLASPSKHSLFLLSSLATTNPLSSVNNDDLLLTESQLQQENQNLNNHRALENSDVHSKLRRAPRSLISYRKRSKRSKQEEDDIENDMNEIDLEEGDKKVFARKTRKNIPKRILCSEKRNGE